MSLTAQSRIACEKFSYVWLVAILGAFLLKSMVLAAPDSLGVDCVDAEIVSELLGCVYAVCLLVVYERMSCRASSSHPSRGPFLPSVPLPLVTL